MWINVGFSFGFIKMILLVIFLAISVYLFFDWNYVKEVIHENIDAGSNSLKKSMNNLDSKKDSNTDKKSSSTPKDQSTREDVLKNGDEFLKKNKEDFFR